MLPTMHCISATRINPSRLFGAQHLRLSQLTRKPLHLTSIRFYARQSARRTTVADTPTQTQTDRPSALQGYKQEEQSQYTVDEESQENALTPETRVHLAKVYGTMTGALGMSGIGAVAGMALPALWMPAAIGSFVGIIGMYFVAKEKVSLRQNIFMGVGALVGITIAPAIAASSAGVVVAAALGTSAICAGFTLMALKAKRGSMLMLGGPLLGGLLFLVAISLATLVLPLLGVTIPPAIASALYSIHLYGGLGIFSLFVAYDTQSMIENFRAGDTDHVAPALNMFLNVINIFVRLLAIFGRND